MSDEVKSQVPVPQGNEEAAPQSSRKWIWAAAGGGVVTLALFVAALVYLLSPGAPTARIRDIFIILLALEGLLVGVALLVLVVQIAVLINLLQNEVRPILDSTTRTVTVLQGTVEFLSKRVAEPVIRLNETVAALSSVAGALNLVRGRKRKPKKGE
ncbi:MAG TPA: hypothetical protein ENJ54_07835 [Chloroflexi bacterium]|nr:hypothetical protein [Chloroflexota bacterium]